VDDAALQRYALLHAAARSADVTATEPLVVEKAPVDDQYDTMYQDFLAEGYSMQGVGRWNGTA